VIFGLGAALGWGLGDLGAALVGRRIGSLATVVLIQAAGLAAVLGVTLLVRPGWEGRWTDLALLLANGVIVAIAYLLHYRALELGPVAIVSPITSAYAVVPIGLAWLVLGERLTSVFIGGAVLATIGVALVSAEARPFGITRRPDGDGIPYAIAAMNLFGVATFILGVVARQVGWLPTVTLGRLFTVIALAPVIAIRRPSLLAAGRGFALAGLGAGIADVAGIMLFSVGVQASSLSLVAAVSAMFPLIPFVGGLVLLRERPALSQSVGVAAIVSGVVLLGLAR
jgi:drug/metabolite transporter (DMT)-like permease